MPSESLAAGHSERAFHLPEILVDNHFRTEAAYFREIRGNRGQPVEDDVVDRGLVV